VTVVTDRGTYEADRLVIAAGAWASRVVSDLGVPLVVRRKPQLWYRPTSDAYRIEQGCPTFLYEMPDGIFYGFPQLDETGMKIAEHTGGAVVDDPGEVDRTVTADDRRGVEAFCRQCLSDVSTDCCHSSVCMYTLTPSGNFIVDLHPRWPQVSLVAGLSGHGFKFAPVLGEALADLAIDGRTSLPIGFLGLARHHEASAG
jgi:glycine/D-amino acid oxidase-like deaminating enzyme